MSNIGGSHSTPIEANKARTSVNVDSVSNQGQFHASAPHDRPQTTHGHQPGRMVSPKDHVQTFKAQTLPPGTAPKERTFQPNNLPDGFENGAGSAMSGMPGATSKDVNQGLGHPGFGMTSTEARHDMHSSRAKGNIGLSSTGQSEMKAADERLDPGQRALDKDTERESDRTKGQMEETALDRHKDSA